MSPIPVPTPTETLEQRVQRLLERWRAEIAHVSSSTQITGHPAYQELISLGTPVLPILFRDLEQTRDGHLAKALAAITGARPVAPEDRGRVGKVADTWLAWAREQGYRW